MLPLNESTLSQIDDDIADRLRAASEKVAGGRLFEWLGSVDDCPGNQAGLTVVTNACAAGPKGGYVARFGQLQNALIFGGVAMRGDAAAGERHKGAGVVFVRGKMGCLVGGADTSRGPGIVAAENFGVNSQRCDTDRREGFFHVRHELGWAAEIGVGISRDADFVEDGARQATGRVEMLSHFVVPAWSAVADMRASVRELAYQAAGFAGERMMLAIASRMEPEDLAC